MALLMSASGVIVPPTEPGSYTVPKSFRVVICRIVQTYGARGMHYSEFVTRFNDQRKPGSRGFHTCEQDEYAYFRGMPDACEVRGTPDYWKIFPAKSGTPTTQKSSSNLSQPRHSIGGLQPVAVQRVTITDLINAIQTSVKMLAGRTLSLGEFCSHLEQENGADVVRFFNGRCKSDDERKQFIAEQCGAMHTIAVNSAGQLKIERPPVEEAAPHGTDEHKYELLKDPPFSTAFEYPPLQPSEHRIGVMVSEFVDPGHFFITTVEDDKKRKQFMDDLKWMYSTQDDSIKQDVYEGMPAVATFREKNDYHRVVVRTIHRRTTPATATVYYVDFGTEVPDIKVDDIRPIYQRFLEMPVFAHLCQLHFIKPMNDKPTYSGTQIMQMGTIALKPGVLYAEIRRFSQSKGRYMVNIEAMCKMFVAKGLSQATNTPPNSSSNGSELEEHTPCSEMESKWQRRNWVSVRTLPNCSSIWLVKTRRGIFVPTPCLAAMFNMTKDLVLTEFQKVKIFPSEIMELEEGNTTDEEIRAELKDSDCPLIMDHSGRLYRKITLIPGECVPPLLKVLPGEIMLRKAVCNSIQRLLIDEGQLK